MAAGVSSVHIVEEPHRKYGCVHAIGGRGGGERGGWGDHKEASRIAKWSLHLSLSLSRCMCCLVMNARQDQTTPGVGLENY